MIKIYKVEYTKVENEIAVDDVDADNYLVGGEYMIFTNRNTKLVTLFKNSLIIKITEYKKEDK